MSEIVSVERAIAFTVALAPLVGAVGIMLTAFR